MSAQLRSELLKQRSISTNLGLFAGLLGLVLLAVTIHGFGLTTAHVDSRSEQLTVLFGRGEFLAAPFAALLGALSITGEIRYGTIRPTFLVTPRRSRVVAAKVWVSALAGAGFGAAASALAVAGGVVAMRLRGIGLELDAGDYALLVAGGTTAAALWAAIGVGVGAVVRSQVPAVLGITAWLLFVEGLLVGDLTGVGNVGRFAPGAAAAAITGQAPETLLEPVAGLLLLSVYATAAAAAGWITTTRRDVA